VICYFCGLILVHRQTLAAFRAGMRNRDAAGAESTLRDAGIARLPSPCAPFHRTKRRGKDCVGRDVFVAFCSRVVKVRINIKQKSRE
jgi:hypothetical protein